MRLVIADTGPVNYLILIRQIDLLPRMFDRVVIPTAVQAELSSVAAPPPVQLWIAAPPVWLEIIEAQEVDPVDRLHRGEAAAIALAATLHADLLLIDERKGVKAARSKGLRVTGILGLLRWRRGEAWLISRKPRIACVKPHLEVRKRCSIKC